MIRNREILYFTLYAGAVSAASVAAAFCLSPAAGGICLAAVLALNGGYALFTAWRYRELRRLSAYLGGVYAGQRALDIRDNTEGELSILKNDLYKITVTLQQQADQLERDKHYLADALSDISHQLKTPLTSAFVMTDLLTRPDLPAEKRDTFVRRLIRQLARMQWLIGALLKLSRLDADAVVFQRAPVSLPDLVRRALEPLEIGMELQGIRCQCDCAPEAVWQGDAGWTLQAVQNVLKNCVEHMPDGGTLSVCCTANVLDCTLEVRDTGGGIPAGDLPHIFERFYKGENAGPESVGIGLALAAGILQKQGARITAENRDGGACFRLVFPHMVV